VTPTSPLDLSFLQTPPSWFIVELLSILLLFWCMADAIRANEGNARIVRIGEIFGFMAYAGVYENIGVAVKVYYYSLDRIMMVGRVPLAILIIEAVIFYAAMRAAETLRMPGWAKPFFVGLFAMLQDLTIDPSACYDLHNINGVLEGRWNWTLHYQNTLFGIPFFNFSGWFTMMFYYAAMMIVGRRFFVRRDRTTSVGVAYILLGALLSLVLIVSPINRFLLKLEPFSPWDQRTNELVMLLVIIAVSGSISLRYLRPAETLGLKEHRVILLVPAALHTYDILAAYILRIEIAYVPSILFAVPHLALLTYLFRPEWFSRSLRARLPLASG
jgi:hypothetical protein